MKKMLRKTDGLYNSLAVEVTMDLKVIVENAGNYALNARIMDENEDEIVWAATTSWLSAGLPQIMNLNFDGDAIYNHGVDGPSYLRDVYVYNMADVSQSDCRYDAYTTGAYSYWQCGNFPPIADANGPSTGIVGEPITFNGTGSYDPDGTIVRYEWDLDDATGATPTKTWDVPYSGNICLRVTDDEGAADIDTTTLTAEEAVDTTPIVSVTLDAYTTIPDAAIHVTVEAPDNVGVIIVTADGAALVESESIWEGSTLIADRPTWTWQGGESPAGSETMARYQMDSIGTREAQRVLPRGVCAINVNVGRKTSSRTFRQKMKEMNQWLKGARNRVKLKVWWQLLTQKLIGHYQYHFYTRSRRRGCTPEEPDEGKPHVRFCEGAHSNSGAITPIGGGL